MKAFLSHSSKDKEFIKEVADQLGRADCIFDSYSFSMGKEFERSIVDHLSNTSVFVFFATMNSISSLWCDYEIKEALHNKIRKNISRSIVFIIGDDVGLNDIPDWLKRSPVKFESSPSLIAREIRYQLIQSSDRYQHPIFIGRSKETEMLEDVVAPYNGRDRPKYFALFGLPGIGRRSLLSKCINDLFSLQRIIEIELEAGDNANSFCVKLADKSESYSCQDELRHIIAEIEALSESDAISRSLINIEKLVLSGELPVLVDVGGCLNDNGTFKNYLNKLISNSVEYRDAYYAFVLPRRVNRENDQPIECIPIDQLSKKSTAQLLSNLSDRYKFKINHEQIIELTEYIDGYPPSANYVAKQASIYGVPNLIRDKRQLVLFSRKRFVTHIKEQNLKDNDDSVLRVLASFSPLPLDALISLYGEDVNESTAHDNIYELIDCSLIRVTEGQNYRISDPIKGAVIDVLGRATKYEMEKIVKPLRNHIKNVDDESILDFSRVLYRIGYTLGNKSDENEGIRLRSDLIKLLEQAYHQQRYREAVSIGYEAVKECPTDSSPRNYLIKALIQEEIWKEAERYIDDLYPIDELRNVYYLRGFLERKRGDINAAITYYNLAKRNGRGGVSIHRELAHCYIMIDELGSAREHIDKALLIHSDNAHIIDMGAKLEIKRGNENASLTFLKQLELIDDPKHYHMRASAFHLKFGRSNEALLDAEKSVDSGGKMFLSGRVQLIKAYIYSKKYTEATDELAALDRDFQSKKNDVKTALKCILAAAQGDNYVGLKLVEKFTNQTSKQAVGLKKKFLTSLCNDTSIQYEQRTNYRALLNELASDDEFSIDDIEA